MKTARKTYTAYIKSTKWRAIRAKVLFRDGGRCVCCRAGGRGLEVHHKTYARFGNESMNDLVTLCHTCHEKQHKNQQGKIANG